MQKVTPAKNTMDMDFLNGFDKPIGQNAPAQAKVENEAPAQTVIDPVSMDMTDKSISDDMDFDDDYESMPQSPGIKTTQIVIRTTTKERDALKSYFMKHGISLSKGIKIAVKYLEQQEKKGQVHFSDIGLY